MHFPIGWHSAIKMRVKARKLQSWEAVDGVADPVPQSPAASDEPIQRISPVPHTAAKLRITAFPAVASTKMKADIR